MKRRILEINVKHILLTMMVVIAGLFCTGPVYAWNTGDIVLQLYVDESGLTGHSWLGVYNHTSDEISIGTYWLGSEETVYIAARGAHNAVFGSIGPQTEMNFDGGAFFNYEAAEASPYKDYIVLQKTITGADLALIFKRMKEFQDYDLATNNCTTFAGDIWNSVSNQAYPFSLLDVGSVAPKILKQFLTLKYINDASFGNNLPSFGKTFYDAYYVSPSGFLQPCAIEVPSDVTISLSSITDKTRKVKVSWSKVARLGVTGYYIDVFDGEGNKTQYIVSGQNTTNYEIELQNSLDYSIKVGAFSDRAAEDGIRTASDYNSIPEVKCPALTIKLNVNKKTTFAGNTFSLTATTSQYTDAALKWTSSDESIVTVNDGKVTAKKPGQATITVSIRAATKIQDSCVVTVKSNIPAKQDITKVENVGNGIRITWPKSSNAEGYKILRKANNGTWKTIKTIKDVDTVQYIDTEVSNGVLYTYTVKGYIGPNLSEYNKTGLKMYRLSQVYITECKSPGGGKATLVWSKRGVADGYYLYYSKSSKFESFTKKQIAGADNTTATLSGLTKGQTYYFKIRPYKVIDGKTYYGVPSAVKNVTIKTPSVDITESSASLKIGDTSSLNVTVKNVSKSDVKWTSSNTSVATVSSNGVVTGKKAGSATITAKAAGVSDTCKITVHPFDGGKGTKADPYLVRTLAQLKAIKNYPKRHFKQIANINGNSSVFIPLFTNDNPYSGTYNGNGHNISNLRFTAARHSGVFGVIGENGVIKNLNVSQFTFLSEESTFWYEGAIAGLNRGLIQNCKANQLTMKNMNTEKGGIVGYNYGTVKSCQVTNATMCSSSSKGYETGGIVSVNFPDAIIQSCIAANITITEGEHIGGILGWNEYGTVMDCIVRGSLNLSGSRYIGTFVGGGKGNNVSGCVDER